MLEIATFSPSSGLEFDPFAGPPLLLVVPITEPQAEIWTACQLGGSQANRAYNESVCLHLVGPLNVPALEKAWNSLILRHEALRTTISANGQYLCILADLLTPLPLLDFTEQAADQQQTAVADCLSLEANHLFDLLTGPLAKATLIKFNDTHWQLLLTAHHIICDGWSMGVLMQDLGQFYSAYAQAREPELPPAPQLSQYAIDQYAFCRSDAYRQSEAFWVNQFSQNVPVVNLPTDSPRPVPRTYAGRRADFSVPFSLVTALKKVGIGAGSSFVSTLTAAVECWLHKQTGQTDLVLGLPTAGQPTAEQYGLVGHCVSLLPLRSVHLANESFTTYLKKRRPQLLDCLEHQQITFGSLLRKLRLPRDPARVPLVPVVFNVDMGLADGVDFFGLKQTLSSNPRQYENFELSLNATGSEQSLVLEWSYNAHLFTPATVAGFHTSLVRLLETVTAHPDQLLIAETPAPAPAKTGYLNGSAKATNGQVRSPGQKSLTALLAEAAAVYPQKTAIRFGTESLTYSQLVAQANQLAHALLAQGIEPGQRVGLAVDRSLPMVTGMLAILATGATYVPVDPQHPTDRIAYILTDSGCTALLFSDAHRGRFALPGVNQLVVEQLLATLGQYPQTPPPNPPTAQTVAYVLYTSGTTGRPKGATIRHGSVANVLFSVQQQPGFSASDKTIALATIAFDLAVVEIYLPLVTGAELILVDQATSRNAEKLAALLQDQTITFVQTTPATYRLLLEVGWRGHQNLRLICCAEALPLSLARQLLPCCTDLWNFYGPTETTIYATGAQITAADERITIGKPIANTLVYVLDEAGQPVAAGQPGELVIAGAGVSAGYLNQPALTAEKFIPNPFSPATSATLYRTGDLVRLLPSGDVDYLGRIDQQVKIRGIRIELGEIEHALSRVAAIREAVVMAREDQPGNQRLVAYVVPDPAHLPQQAATWQQRWDTIYEAGVRHQAQDATGNVPDLDVLIAEQLSNQTTLRQQADEWLAQSVKRLRALGAKRVLEVGSGAGQLLFELAPDTDLYVATDYAQTAIDALNQRVANAPGQWPQVRALMATAHDFSMVEPASLDLVLVHSVAQYFPDLRYFLQVIEGAVKTTKSGGCVFIGDMQSRQLQAQHHTADQWPRTAPGQTIAEFRQLIDRRISRDDELMADPAFFYLLPTLLPAIGAVDVQLREGTTVNETTKYHFDVWLYVGESPPVAPVDRVLNGSAEAELTEAITRQFAAFPDQTLAVTGLFNARTAPDFALAGQVRIAADYQPVDLLKNALINPEPAHDPANYWLLAEKMRFRAHVRWATDGHDNRFEVVFIPISRGACVPPVPTALTLANADLRSFINEPYAPVPTVSEGQIRAWRQQVGQFLPDYMVPAEFVVLPRLPITPNGKLDRNALPAPLTQRTYQPTEADHPRQPTTPEEILVATLWRDALGVAEPGLDNNFFELGGHSMMAVQVMTRLEKETGRRLPLASLFEYPTIRSLATLLQPDTPAVSWQTLVPIKPTGTREPLYIVHGAGLNVLLFNAVAQNLDADQPVYGLQARGLNGVDEPFYSIDEMARHYVNTILAHNPTGPYSLSGFSFGGIVAFEMARQLLEQGRTVSLVALFDAYAYDAGRSNPWWQRKAQGAGLFLNKVLHTLRLFKKHRWQAVSYKMQSIDRKLIKHYWWLKPSTRLDQVLYRTAIRTYWQLKFGQQQQQEAMFDITFKIEAINDAALQQFQLLPADLAVHLFRATIQTFYMDDYDYYGWRDFARKGVHIYDVPGEHSYIFAPPNDKEFAAKLQAVLNGRGQ